MKNYPLMALGILMTSPLFGALPPAWQEVREIKSILNDNRLGNYLESGDVIQNITKTERGWEINTNHSLITIDVVPEKQTMPGPEKFHLEFKREPLKN